MILPDKLRLIADWCIRQDDLTAFRLDVNGHDYDYGREVTVVLDWRGGWRSAIRFDVREMEPAFSTDYLVVQRLDASAESAREHAPRRKVN